MKNSKHYYILVLSFLIFTNSFSQQTDKVSIKTVGQGITISDATANALREAISQAYGVFISANTTIVNDSLLKDEIVSLTTGNIEKYDVLSQTEIPNIGYSVILNSVVSLGKLSSFAQSKGAEASFDGGGFAMNIKLQKLNEQAELKALSNLLQQTWLYIQNSISFNLSVGEPKLSNQTTETYSLSVQVKSKLEDSIRIEIQSFLFTGLDQLCLSGSELTDFKNLGKKVYFLEHSEYLGEQTFRRVKTYNFRNQKSLQLMYVFSFKLNNLFYGFELSNNLETDSLIKLPSEISGDDFITYEHPAQYFFQMSQGYEHLFNYCKNSPYSVNLDFIYNLMNSDFHGENDINDFANFIDILNKNRYLFDDRLWDYHLNYFKNYSEPQLYTLGLIVGPIFTFNYDFSLSDLEKLKDFKVEKYRNNNPIFNSYDKTIISDSDISKDTTVHVSTDIMPSFPGGDELLLRYFEYALELPSWAQGYGGKLEVSFIVESDGSITNVDLSKPINSYGERGKEIDKAVIQVIKDMPKWNPGIHNGNKVRVLMKLPVILG